MAELTAGLLTFHINEHAQNHRWSADGLPLECAPRPDFWRLQADDGRCRDLSIKSSDQTGRVTVADGQADIAYESLVAPTGRRFAFRMVVHVRAKSGCFHIWADLENRDPARINELKLPFLDFRCVGDPAVSRDVLYRGEGLGDRLSDPWSALYRAHSEYVHGDDREVWWPVSYPISGAMPWQGLESGGHFLYLGRHDPEFRTILYAAGVAPRKQPRRLLFSISGFPFLARGERERTGLSVVSLSRGTWRDGSDLYGAWARAAWYRPPDTPDWVKAMTGWQRIILKHQYGEIFFPYADLPRVFREGRRYGLDTLMVFGWWRRGFDNGYPEYEPDEELGGADALRRAIAEIRAMGGRVALYTNGVLIDAHSDFFAKEGLRCCRKNLDGGAYRDSYGFSGDGLLMRVFRYKQFVTACQSTMAWRERLRQNARTKLGFEPDSIFFDQLSGHTPDLCFDASHPHGNRVDRENRYLIENLQMLRGLCRNGQALGSEGIADAYAPYVDYHHGNQHGNGLDATAFPALFRRTFPEPIVTNRFTHDSREGFERQLNFAFIHGYRYDVSIYRGRTCGIAGDPAYAERIKRLVDEKARYAGFFYGDGRFLDVADPPPPLKGCLYRDAAGRVLAALWNDSDRPANCSFEGRRIRLPPQEVGCVELEAKAR